MVEKDCDDIFDLFKLFHEKIGPFIKTTHFFNKVIKNNQLYFIKINNLSTWYLIIGEFIFTLVILLLFNKRLKN